MELQVTYSFQGTETENIKINYEDLEFLEQFLKNWCSDAPIECIDELEEAIYEFMWNNLELTKYLPSTVDEVLEISLESSLIKQLVVKYHHLITTNCCIRQTGNYCSTCGKKLK